MDETSDTTSYPIKAFTRNANLALDYINALILKADGNWEYQDTNTSGTLIDTSQTFSSGATSVSIVLTWLVIDRVRITDPNGNYVTLIRVDRVRQSDFALNQTAGTPVTYYLLGNKIYFDKPTNYAGTIEVQYETGPSYFTDTDTTKTPGFAVQFHRLVSMLAARDYCAINDLQARVAQLSGIIGTPVDLTSNEPGSGLLKELMDFYAQRDQDEQPAIHLARDDYGQLSLGNNTSSWTNPKGFNILS